MGQLVSAELGTLLICLLEPAARASVLSLFKLQSVAGHTSSAQCLSQHQLPSNLNYQIKLMADEADGDDGLFVIVECSKPPWGSHAL